MITEIDESAGEFRKRAKTPAERERLGHEALVLAAAAHPGVVHLLGFEGGDLIRLRLVTGTSPTDTSTIAGDLATTVADLHEIGIVHGSIGAEHVLVDRSGLPILCSFGDGRTGADPHGPETAADVAALAAYLLAGTRDPAQHRVLAAATRRRAPTARQLADRLAALPPADPARPPGGGRSVGQAPIDRRFGERVASPPAKRPRRRPDPVGSSDGRRPSRRIGRLVRRSVMAAVVLGAAVVVIAGTRSGRRPPAPGCPVADQGCRPVPDPGGVISVATGRYRIGEPGDVVVLGRWHCRSALPALLQPNSGEVWLFDSWAGTGATLLARLVARVPGAVSLGVIATPSGCDDLMVTRVDRAAVVVHPGPAP